MIKKLIIVIELVILFSILASNSAETVEMGVNSSEINEQEVKIAEQDLDCGERYYYMTATAYSNDSRCIAKKWHDGKTAMGTEVREGVVAINVDWINGRWKVRSPLKLGERILIEDVGYFSVEDTGYFTEKDLNFDFWNVDVYKKDYEQAREWGVKRVKVVVLE